MLTQEEFTKNIANNLRTLRRNNSFTLEKLAEKCSIDYSTVALIENGKQNPRLYTFYKILYALEVDFTKLLNDKNDEMNDTEKLLFQKISQLDEDSMKALIDFIDNYTIIKK